MLKEGKFKTRTLDLQESLELQKEQATRLKKTQLDQAAARLKERLKIGGEQQSDPVQLTKEQLMAYRTPTAKGILLTTCFGHFDSRNCQCKSALNVLQAAIAFAN